MTTTTDSLQPIRDAINRGDKTEARRLLRPHMDNPTAEGWYLASLLVEDNAQKITCLRRALALDPWHSAANRDLLKLEGSKPPQADRNTIRPIRRTFERQHRKLEVEKTQERRRRWSRLGCLMGLPLSLSCTLFSLNAIGLVPGVISTFTQVSGGPTPVLEIDGVPLRDVPDAPVRVEPSTVENVTRDTDILEHGYAHEYRFAGREGQDYAVYVQFISVAASNVARNVVVLDPNDVDKTSGCRRDYILQDDRATNVTLVCRADQTGTWKVRVLGRQGESTGAYFVGVEPLAGE